MKIKIAQRLHPFSHRPGTSLLLPGTSLVLQIFPTKILLGDLCEVDFSLTGPVEGFTIIQDLERCEVRVFGHAKEGYFRYRCRPDNVLELVKGNISFTKPENIVLEKPLVSNEHLSLGSHKKQDLASMHAWEELLPIWFRLGMMTPQKELGYEGTASLLKVCDEAIAGQNREALLPAFQNLYLAGFSDLFVPRLEDTLHQGFAVPPLKKSSLSPLILLTEGARLIRRLFIQQEGSRFAILPALPPNFIQEE